MTTSNTSISNNGSSGPAPAIHGGLDARPDTGGNISNNGSSEPALAIHGGLDVRPDTGGNISKAPWTLPRGRPYIIAHRGASGELPEHTLQAYQQAIDQGG
jgi:hypothetical protein